MNPKVESTLERAVESLKAELAVNLYSCCLYGSAVRGNAIEGVSDLNVLLVLNESDASAHSAVARALKDYPQIDPFVLGKRGFERSTRAFAPKFVSIRRNYRLLYGADPLAELKVDVGLERFLCEQALRNLRLRLVYSFITRGRHKAYDRFLVRNVTPLFVNISEVLRLENIAIPAAFEARLPILEREFNVDADVLRDLLALKRAPSGFSEPDAVKWHERVFPVIDAVLRWIEDRWTK